MFLVLSFGFFSSGGRPFMYQLFFLERGVFFSVEWEVGWDFVVCFFVIRGELVLDG